MGEQDRTGIVADDEGAAALRQRLRVNGAQLAARCDPAGLGFGTTAELSIADGPPGQQRALEAIGFALGIARPGFNLFAIGSAGLGMRPLIETMARARAGTMPVPPEFCYVNNFAEPYQPIVLEVPPGVGSRLKEAMARFVVDVKAALGAAFASEDHRAALEGIQAEVAERQSELIETVRKQAAEMGIALMRTPLGFGMAPMRDGRTLTPEEFQELAEDEQATIKAHTADLERRLHAAMQRMPLVVDDAQKKTRALNEATAKFAVAHLVKTIKKAFRDHEGIVAYLDAVEADVIANADKFLMAPEQALDAAAIMAEGPTLFWRYRVNLLVDHAGSAGAPVVFEDEPTFERLLGRIEHRVERAALVTDFNLVRPGSLHRANGGFLMIEARRLLRQPFAWEALKRVLEAGEIRIESLSAAVGWTSTTTLEPQPVPLTVKVLLFGDRELYYLLARFDPDLRDHFKVLADFDEAIDRDEDAVSGFVDSIAALVRDRGLMPFEAAAVARLIDLSVRDAADVRKLSADVERLADVMQEAEFIAAAAGRSTVTARDVDAAEQARRRRHMRVSERLQEAMERRAILIDTEGERIGQVNGLSVYRLGDVAFGKPSRITARVRLGRGEVVDIEREVELGGPIHSKGVLVLSGFLGGRYARQAPLSLSASLVFEQSYGGVEGDSASTAELVALLSALAEVPVSQALAITGSVNQHGQVQVIGGLNEKIEGFFDLCAARGLDGRQGVVFPAGNLDNLMLDRRVTEAVASGKFHLYAVATVDEALALLTGREPGAADAGGRFPPASVNGRVEARLAEFARRRKAFGTARDGADGTGGDAGAGGGS